MLLQKGQTGLHLKSWQTVGSFIHSVRLACRRDKLGMHQVVFEVGGAVRITMDFFLENII